MTRFEVLIPTMEGRERYLEWCIRSCLTQNHDSFAVLVSNNGGAQSVRKLVESIDDPRLRYVETSSVLPMCFHWEFMFKHASGEYLSIIGDDDALMPDALVVVDDILKGHPGINAVTHEPAHYYWPDYPIHSLRNKYSLRCQDRSIGVMDSRAMLAKVAEFREWYGQLPFLYHGFVAKRVLLKMATDLGGIFLRPAPDVFVDLVLGKYVGPYVQLKDCLTIGGQGAKSTGLSCVFGDEPGKDFIETHPDNIRPKYSIGSINLQLFEYMEHLEEDAAYPDNRKINWGRLFISVFHEALLAQNENQCKMVLGDLKHIFCKKSPYFSRNYFLGVLWLAQMPVVFTFLRFLIFSRREFLNARLGNAQIDFAATNIYQLAESLRTQADQFDENT